MKWFILSGFAVLVISRVGLALGDDAIKGDLKALQGAWSAKSESGEVSYTFEGKTLKVDAPSRRYTITVTLDETAKPHKSIDMKINEAPEDAKGKTSKGIYKIEGADSVVICFSGMGERPTEFVQNGFEQIVVTLKRAKGKPAPTKSSVDRPLPKAADGDSPLPEGWPGATPPGAIEIKKYPSYRSAIARAKDARSTAGNILFFSLFNHISKSGIEMTAPVVMTYDPKVAENSTVKGNLSMEFLYRNTHQGKSGPGVGAVKVEDFPEATFVCLGIQGEWNAKVLEDGIAKLHAWLEDHKSEWLPAGPPRRLGYHGPMTPVARQLNEVQIPVKPAAK